MRFLVDIEMPVEPFNSYVRDGSAGAKMQQALSAVRPEAAYFCARNGKRGGTLVINMDNVSEIPKIAEPFFLLFNATLTLHPAMTPEDLAKSGLDSIGKQF